MGQNRLQLASLCHRLLVSSSPISKREVKNCMESIYHFKRTSLPERKQTDVGTLLQLLCGSPGLAQRQSMEYVASQFDCTHTLACRHAAAF